MINHLNLLFMEIGFLHCDTTYSASVRYLQWTLYTWFDLLPILASIFLVWEVLSLDRLVRQWYQTNHQILDEDKTSLHAQSIRFRNRTSAYSVILVISLLLEWGVSVKKWQMNMGRYSSHTWFTVWWAWQDVHLFVTVILLTIGWLLLHEWILWCPRQDLLEQHTELLAVHSPSSSSSTTNGHTRHSFAPSTQVDRLTIVETAKRKVTRVEGPVAHQLHVHCLQVLTRRLHTLEVLNRKCYKQLTSFPSPRVWFHTSLNTEIRTLLYEQLYGAGTISWMYIPFRTQHLFTSHQLPMHVLLFLTVLEHAIACNDKTEESVSLASDEDHELHESKYGDPVFPLSSTSMSFLSTFVSSPLTTSSTSSGHVASESAIDLISWIKKWKTVLEEYAKDTHEAGPGTDHGLERYFHLGGTDRTEAFNQLSKVMIECPLVITHWILTCTEAWTSFHLSTVLDGTPLDAGWTLRLFQLHIQYLQWSTPRIPGHADSIELYEPQLLALHTLLHRYAVRSWNSLVPFHRIPDTTISNVVNTPVELLFDTYRFFSCTSSPGIPLHTHVQTILEHFFETSYPVPETVTTPRTLQAHWTHARWSSDKTTRIVHALTQLNIWSRLVLPCPLLGAVQLPTHYRLNIVWDKLAADSEFPVEARHRIVAHVVMALASVLASSPASNIVALLNTLCLQDEASIESRSLYALFNTLLEASFSDDAVPLSDWEYLLCNQSPFRGDPKRWGAEWYLEQICKDSQADLPFRMNLGLLWREHLGFPFHWGLYKSDSVYHHHATWDASHRHLLSLITHLAIGLDTLYSDLFPGATHVSKTMTLWSSLASLFESCTDKYYFLLIFLFSALHQRYHGQSIASFFLQYVRPEDRVKWMEITRIHQHTT